MQRRLSVSAGHKDHSVEVFSLFIEPVHCLFDGPVCKVTLEGGMEAPRG